MTDAFSGKLGSKVPPIEVTELSISRGSHYVLKNVDLTIKQGVFAALVGPSGCGKTSLLRVLALLDKPAAGRVCLFGCAFDKFHDYSLICPESIYPRLNYVPQTLGLWPHLSIRQNFLFGATNSPNLEERMTDLCGQLEISLTLDSKPQQLSQGQRQRAALVRALLLNPQILLLDEITAALDEPLAQKVWMILRAFTRSGGSILASTHSGRLAGACDYSYHISNQSVLIEASASFGDRQT